MLGSEREHGHRHGWTSTSCKGGPENSTSQVVSGSRNAGMRFILRSRQFYSSFPLSASRGTYHVVQVSRRWQSLTSCTYVYSLKGGCAWRNCSVLVLNDHGCMRVSLMRILFLNIAGVGMAYRIKLRVLDDTLASQQRLENST